VIAHFVLPSHVKSYEQILRSNHRFQIFVIITPISFMHREDEELSCQSMFEFDSKVDLQSKGELLMCDNNDLD